MVADAFQLTTAPWETHPWLTVRIGTRRLTRCLIVAFLFVKIILCFSSVAVFIPKAWDGASHPCMDWHTGWSLPSSTSIVFLNLEWQWPVELVWLSVQRTLTMSWEFEFIHQSNVSQLGLRHCFKLMGAPHQDSKAFEASCDRHFLGTSVHTAEFALSGTIRFQPKLQTTSKIIGRLDQALDLKHLDRDTAGKLRGDLNWMFSHCAGNSWQICRSFAPILSSRRLQLYCQNPNRILFTSCSTSSFSPPLWMFGSLAGHL